MDNNRDAGNCLTSHDNRTGKLKFLSVRRFAGRGFGWWNVFHWRRKKFLVTPPPAHPLFTASNKYFYKYHDPKWLRNGNNSIDVSTRTIINNYTSTPYSSLTRSIVRRVGNVIINITMSNPSVATPDGEYSGSLLTSRNNT